MAEPGQDTAPQGSLDPQGPDALPLSEETARPLWLGALATLLLHGGLLALLLWPGQEAAGGSGGAGRLYAIEILVEAGARPGIAPETTAEAAAAAPAPETPAPTPTTTATPDHQPPIAADPVPPAPDEPRQSAALTPPPGPDPAERAPLLPLPGPAPAPTVAEAQAAPETAAAPPEKPTEAVTVPPPLLVAAAPAPALGGPRPLEATAAAVAGQTASPAAGAGTGDVPASVGDLGQARAAYEAAVLAWLQRHKQYPKAAERRRQQGVARVIFTLAPDGRVSDAALLETSGYAALDQEALALLTRAAPLPPFPASLPALPISFTLPVDFSLR